MNFFSLYYFDFLISGVLNSWAKKDIIVDWDTTFWTYL